MGIPASALMNSQSHCESTVSALTTLTLTLAGPAAEVLPAQTWRCWREVSSPEASKPPAHLCRGKCPQVLSSLESLLTQAAAAERGFSDPDQGTARPADAPPPAAADWRRPLFCQRCAWPPRALSHALPVRAAPQRAAHAPAERSPGKPVMGGAAAAPAEGLQSVGGGQQVRVPSVRPCMCESCIHLSLWRCRSSLHKALSSCMSTQLN